VTGVGTSAIFLLGLAFGIAKFIASVIAEQKLIDWLRTRQRRATNVATTSSRKESKEDKEPPDNPEQSSAAKRMPTNQEQRPRNDDPGED
jgi:hypothetical protein